MMGCFKRLGSRPEWIDNFRMLRKFFEELCQLIGPSIVKQNTIEKNFVKKDCVYLSGEGRMRKIAHVFSLGKSTVSKVIREVEIPNQATEYH